MGSRCRQRRAPPSSFLPPSLEESGNQRRMDYARRVGNGAERGGCKKECRNSRRRFALMILEASVRNLARLLYRVDVGRDGRGAGEVAARIIGARAFQRTR